MINLSFAFIHIIFVLIAYLVGSIPFGLLFFKFSTGKDIRKLGSGNIGTTNAFRAGGKVIGFLTMICDVAKGALMVYLAGCFYPEVPELPVYVGFFTIFGHMFPVWLKFKGGKGVATALGVMITLSLPIGLVAIGSFIIVLLLSRVVSLASMFAACIATIYSISLNSPQLLIMMLAITPLIIICHRENIQRLLQGQEKKLF